MAITKITSNVLASNAAQDNLNAGSVIVFTKPLSATNTNIIGNLTVTGNLSASNATFDTGSIATSQPLTLTQTWNASGVTFAAQVVNITTTSSANGSAFFDVKQNGVSRFKVVKSSGATTAQIIINGGDANPCSFTCVGNLLSIANEGNQNVTFNGFTVTRNAGGAAGTGGTITSTQTWNSIASTFTGFNMNVTDTNSAPASLLMDLQVGGVSKFKVAKDGSTAIGSGAIPLLSVNATQVDLNGLQVTANGLIWGCGNSFSAAIGNWATGAGVRFGASGTLAWGPGGANSPTLDLFLMRDSAAVLAQRNGTNAQESRIYSTYTDAANYERFFIKTNVGATSATQIGLSAAGSGQNRSLEFVAGGSTKMTVSSGGTIIKQGLLGINTGYIVSGTPQRVEIATPTGIHCMVGQLGGFGCLFTDNGMILGAASLPWPTAYITTANVTSLSATGVVAAGSMVKFPNYLVADLPSAAGNAGAMIYVSDDIGGPTMAFCNGSNWLRVRDNAIVTTAP